jgi:hypothetical protein
MTYTVESGVQMPRKNVYPFDEMVINDSFEFPKEERNRIRTAASKYTKEFGGKFEIRVIDEGNCRIWRTK